MAHHHKPKCSLEHGGLCERSEVLRSLSLSLSTLILIVPNVDIGLHSCLPRHNVICLSRWFIMWNYPMSTSNTCLFIKKRYFILQCFSCQLYPTVFCRFTWHSYWARNNKQQRGRKIKEVLKGDKDAFWGYLRRDGDEGILFPIPGAAEEKALAPVEVGCLEGHREGCC